MPVEFLTDEQAEAYGTFKAIGPGRGLRPLRDPHAPDEDDGADQ